MREWWLRRVLPRCLRVPLPKPLAGLALGMIAFALSAAYPPPAARSALEGAPDEPVVTAALFAGLWIAFGFLLELLAPLRTRTP